MDMHIKDIELQLRKHSRVVFLIVAILTILVNIEIVSNAEEIFGIILPSFLPSVVGTVASFIYIILAGHFLGKVLLTDEEEVYIRFCFGILLLVFIVVFVGLGVTIFYKLNTLGLAGVLFTPPVLSGVFAKLRKRNVGKEEKNVEKSDKLRFFSPMYVIFLVLIAYSLYLLVRSRSGWVYGTIWDAADPSFLMVFFLAGFVLVGIILYCRTKTSSKILLIILYTFVCVSIRAIVLFPGNYGDPFGHMGTSQIMYEYGTLKIQFESILNPFIIYWLLKGKGLPVLVAAVANMFMIDVYWVHTFIVPVLWSIFVPLITYKIARMLGMRQKVCALAAFLSAFHLSFVIWGSVGVANSLGFIPFFTALYFSLLYLRSEKKTMALPLSVFCAIVSGFTHPFTGVISLIFTSFAIALKRYKFVKSKSTHEARIMLFVAFAVGILGLFAVFAMNNLIYLNFAPETVRTRYAELEVIAFDVYKLQDTDLWKIIFGEYAYYTLKDALLYGSVTFFGVTGFVYALKKTAHGSKFLTFFMVSSFIICSVDYTIMQYAMVHVPFGAGRILVFRDLIAIPFAALTINSLVGLLKGGSSRKLTRSLFTFRGWAVKLSARQVFAWVLIGLSLSAFTVPSIYKSCENPRGLHPTQLEVEAVRYIDEHTNSRYVVISNPTTAMIGLGFMGITNYEKYWVVVKNEYFYEPSVTELVDYMQIAAADVGYYVVSTMRNSNYEKVYAEASRIFGLFANLTNDKGKISIFQYKIPPLPKTSGVMAFYWDAPIGYYVQNDLFRVVFDPTSNYLYVKDPRWDTLYESMDLKKTLVGGEPPGNLTSIE